MNRRGFLKLFASVPLLGSALKVGEAPSAVLPPTVTQGLTAVGGGKVFRYTVCATGFAPPGCFDSLSEQERHELGLVSGYGWKKIQ